MQAGLLPVPFVIFGGIVIWVIVFLATYPHFPRMEKQKRIRFTVTSATIMAAAMMAILLVAMYFFIDVILK